MNEPVSPIRLAEFRALLERYGFAPSKGRGQNFLHDPKLCAAIAQAAELGAADRVLEIGTGCGYLTAALAARAGQLLTVEIEPKLHAIARELLADRKNIEFLLGDFLDGKEIAAPILARLREFAPTALVANLPYSVGGTALGALSLFEPAIPRMVFTVQKEVAVRCAAPAGSGERGPLTLLLQLYYRAKILRDVPPAAFWPRPRVDSSIVRLDRVRERLPAQVESRYLALVHELFSQKRKQIGKTLREAFYPGDALAAQAALTAAGVDATARAEELSVEQFLILAQA